MSISSDYVNTNIYRPSGVLLPLILREKLSSLPPQSTKTATVSSDDTTSTEENKTIQTTTPTSNGSIANNVNTNNNNLDSVERNGEVITSTPKTTEETKEQEKKVSFKEEKSNKSLSCKEIEDKIKSISSTLLTIQKSLYHGEESYYEESLQYGNIFKGWEYNTFIDYKLISFPTSNGNKARFGRSGTMPDEDRWFSNSCHISKHLNRNNITNKTYSLQSKVTNPSTPFTTKTTSNINNIIPLTKEIKQPKNSKMNYAIPRKQPQDSKLMQSDSKLIIMQTPEKSEKKKSLDTSGSSKRNSGDDRKKRTKKRKTE